MSVATEAELSEFGGVAGRTWWLFLISGIAWAVIAFAVLTVDPYTPATIGYLAGFFLLLAGVNEFVTGAVVEDLRWLHIVLGILFAIAGVMALLDPFQTFGILALLIGWYLLFKGISDIIVSIIGRAYLPLWGLLLASGILELAIGVWAIGYPGRSAWLLVLWVGIAALSRGITEIVLAFRLRSAGAAFA
jgi:uncharacterized membrane protein HdeD (DUF308 family)